MSPLHLFRRLAVAEAITWALLLIGMALKYTDVTELGVRVFGMVHGLVFDAYCLGTLVVAVDQRWTARRTLLGLASSIPPFATVWFDRYAERHDALGARWRLRDAAPARGLDRPVAWLLRNPLRGAAAGLVAVLVLAGVALLAGPPVG